MLRGLVAGRLHMHGVTKELHRLVKASALLESSNDLADSSTPSERVYGRLLAEMADLDREGVRTRVVVDVVARAPAAVCCLAG